MSDTYLIDSGREDRDVLFPFVYCESMIQIIADSGKEISSRRERSVDNSSEMRSTHSE